MQITELVGAWKLNEFVITDTNGSREWRKGAHGLLIYTSTGHMSVSINSPIDNSALEDSLLFYAGTYSLQNNIVVHMVSNATDPNRIGKEMLREAQLQGNILRLCARGDFGTATLVWEKLT